MKRSALREKTAGVVNALSRKELLEKFAISRVADLTGLDRIGVPVYSCSRVLSQSIAIHSGKGITPEASRAGAILEAIEFEVAEFPKGPFSVASANDIPVDERLAIEDCFPTRSSVVNNLTPLAWETTINVQNGETKLVPSDLIWMVPRLKHQLLMYLQMGSNGLASGGTLEDAILGGLYELIERDAWTLNQYLLDYCGMMPVRTPLASLPERLETLVRKIEAAGVKLHLFEITNDYVVPVYSAILLDKTGNCAGTFGGYGAHLNAEIAAIRAVTEAIQGRAGYISGARDDLFRRQFLLMKRMDQEKLDTMFSEMETGSLLTEHRTLDFSDVKTELRYLLKLLKSVGVNQVFVKDMGSFLDDSVHIVRVFSPQCEPFRFDHWAPGLRCLSYAQRYMEQLSDGRGKTAPAVEEGEAWQL
jgi:ribosomal protein S12 methylthiotransferase accessory factor